MKNETLLGHVAERFSGQVENIATESLAFVVNRTPTAKKAFIKFLEQAGIALGDAITINTQRAESDESQPDMTGKDSSGKTVLFVEAKFWAGLTDSQPCKYLKHLAQDAQSMLVFIAPSRRLPTLWAEVLRRCKDDGRTLPTTQEVNAEFRTVKLNENTWLGAVSWREMLSYILRSVETEGNHDAAADIKQLIGLCEKQNDEAFLPLAPEELHSQLGRRIVQFNRIVNLVTDKLVADGCGSLKGVKATGAENWFGRYIRISGYGCLIHFHAGYWAKWRETPLWFNIKEVIEGQKDWVVTNSLRRHLESLERENPSELFFDKDDDDVPVVPLFIPFWAEQSEVVDSIVRRIKDVIGLLPKKG
jgi:hypothetical protein